MGKLGGILNPVSNRAGPNRRERPWLQRAAMRYRTAILQLVLPISLEPIPFRQSAAVRHCRSLRPGGRDRL